MRIQSARRNMFDYNDTGRNRMEGLMLGMIEWWVQYHAIDDDLRKTADGCDFSQMSTQNDANIGIIICNNSQFWKRFLNDVDRDPPMSLMMKIVMEPHLDHEYLKFLQSNGKDVQKETSNLVQMISNHFHYRFKVAIGYRLVMNGWWKENEKRIKKERSNFKSVSEVHAC